jgi:glutathione synthase/RimK-type ligase-like ATP-grasp enzyme
MGTLYLLTDFKGQFGCNVRAVPYRSGLDIALLKEHFEEAGYELQVISAPDVDLRAMDFAGQYVLCTDTEDPDCLYKNYLEDIYIALELQGAILIPRHKYIRAHHNKVFMEFLRDLSPLPCVKSIRSHHFGTLEELADRKDSFQGPHVVKGAAGAKSRYVKLGADPDDLVAKAAMVSRSRNIAQEWWDFGRSKKHKGYVRDSRFRRKFIVQTFVPGLSNDWRVAIYGDKYFVGRRPTRENDFRASGSGLGTFEKELPPGLLDFATEIYDSFDVPQISIDVGYDGRDFHLFEFQFLLFSTTPVVRSPHHFTRSGHEWVRVEADIVIEEEYARSVVRHLERRENAKPRERAKC